MNYLGWIIYNGHLQGDKFVDFANWIQKAAKQKGIETKVIKNNHLLSYLSSDNINLKQLTPNKLPDFVVFADKDIALAKQLEMIGIPVFNSSSAIEISDNKITTYQHLAEAHLPIPKTIVGPKIFPGVKEIDLDSFKQIDTYFSFPVVIKEAYGSFGEQVYLVHSKEELLHKISEIGDKSYVIQEFISSSYGRDIRLNVVGEQVVASMIRRSANDFRANVSAGGSMEKYEPTAKEMKLAVEATKVIGADFAGVDLLFGENNEPVICEINSNAHIRNIYDCTNINVADYIVDYIINKMDLN